MNSILSIGEFPIITSKIEIDTKLLSKKKSESEEKHSTKYVSTESIQAGDGIPVRTITVSSIPSLTASIPTASIPTQISEPNYTLLIIIFIIFLILAGASYYYYINLKKK